MPEYCIQAHRKHLSNRVYFIYRRSRSTLEQRCTDAWCPNHSKMKGWLVRRLNNTDKKGWTSKSRYVKRTARAICVTRLNAARVLSSCQKQWRELQHTTSKIRKIHVSTKRVAYLRTRISRIQCTEPAQAKYVMLWKVSGPVYVLVL